VLFGCNEENKKYEVSKIEKAINQTSLESTPENNKADSSYIYFKEMLNKNNLDGLVKNIDPYDAGCYYMKDSSYEAAIKWFNLDITQNPNSDSSYTNIGVCKMHLSNNEEAINDFNRAIELGFVKITKELKEQFALEYPDE
jgi:tetratricopeptide (TPR) repeat protein